MKSFTRKVAVVLKAHLMTALLLAAASSSQAEPESQAPKDQVAALALARKPALPRPMIFPRTVMNYNDALNYQQNMNNAPFIDRPLLYDRSLFNPKSDQDSIRNAFESEMRIAGRYGVDGLAMLSLGNCDQLRDALRVAESSKDKGFRVLPELYGGFGDVDKAFPLYSQVVKSAIESPVSAKIGGKAVISSYFADKSSAEEWKEMLRRLHGVHGDSFVFIAAIAAPKGKSLKGWHQYIGAYLSKGVPAQETEALKAHIRSYLDVCDGVMYTSSNHLEEGDHFFSKGFYRNYLAKAFLETLAEPRFQGKLFGLSAALGYVNHFTASTQREEGLRQLIDSLDIALEARPDLVIMPEWNEVSENTCLQPTVSNSFSAQRVISYYAARLKGEEPRSNPGDDVSVPNLIFSAPRAIRLGEAVGLELLNVPAPSPFKSYEVSCALLDESGRTLKEFPPETFEVSKLESKTWRLASEETPLAAALVPVLKIKTSDGKALSFDKGLAPVEVRATWNWNFQHCKQPLRDIALPKSDFFSLASKAERDAMALELKGAIECKEPLASVEIMDGESSIWAADRRDEWKTGSDETVLNISWTAKEEVNPLSIEISAEGGSIRYFQNNLRALGAREDSRYSRSGDAIVFAWKANFNRRGASFIVANKEKAVLRVKSKAFDLSMPVKRLDEQGIYAENYEQGIFLLIEKQLRVPDIPFTLGKLDAFFETRAALTRTPCQLHMTAIAESGRIFRSRPICHPAPVPSDELEAVNVYSETQGKAVQAKVRKAAAIDLNYAFNPALGGVLECPAGRLWHAESGSGWGLGGSSMLCLGGIFANSSSSIGHPQGVSTAAPAWTRDGERQVLSFNGKGDFIQLPREAVPARAPFTLSMEIMPDKEDCELLLEGTYPNVFAASLEKGVLTAKFRLRKPNGAVKDVSTSSQLAVPKGVWSRVEISYDLNSVAFNVNGSKSKVFECEGVCPELFSSSVFGGMGRDEARYFGGKLAALRIQHRCVR